MPNLAVLHPPALASALLLTLACGGDSGPGAASASGNAGDSGTTTTGSAATTGSTSAGTSDTGASNGSTATTGTSSSSNGGSSTTGASTADDTSSTTGSDNPTSGSCDGVQVTVNRTPLGCDFSWGQPDDSPLDFVSTWVGFEEAGGIDTYCNGCSLVEDMADGGAVVVYYAYFIGFQANLMGGYGDCNVDFDDETLCTRGAEWIRDNRQLIIEMYANYARMTYEASPNQGTIWWLEGDFVQYSYDDQSTPLSMGELGDLARDITCAIKSNQPNATVAMNHSPWISDEESDDFWSAMPMDIIDLVWVQGPGDSSHFVNAGDYNTTTANYAWLSQKTGANIMAETSWASSSDPDRWSTATASDINARIDEGVIGVLVNNPAGSYTSNVADLAGQLDGVCQ